MAILCMHIASGHDYRNSSVIVDLAMRQIPHSTERISSKIKNKTVSTLKNTEQHRLFIDIYV